MAEKPLQAQLRDAIDRGALAQIRVLVAGGADLGVGGKDPDAETPLIHAIHSNHLSVVQLLIELSADVNRAGTLSGWTPLMHALDKPEILRELILAGADINARTQARELFSPVRGRRLLRGGETALHLAAAANNADAVRILAQAGAKIEVLDESGCAPLDVALKVGSPTDAAVALVEAGAELTPDRMEAMHSGAHDAHSTLRFFPSIDEISLRQANERETDSQRSPSSSRLTEPDDKKRACPKCGAMLYSRKVRLCGRCGAVLSPELGLGDDQARMVEDQRKWARDLADALASATGPADSARRPPSGRGVQRTAASPADLIRRRSYAEEFRNRARPEFWMYLGAGVLVLALFEWMLSITGASVPGTVYLIGLGSFGIALYLVWQRAAPICPNCGKNVTSCDSVYCHGCGEPLRSRVCEACGVDRRSTRVAAWFSGRTGSERIVYCPGCGVLLDSRVVR